MDITLTVDEKVFSLGMEYAKEHHIHFNELVSQSLEQTVKPSIKDNSSKQWWKETLKLMEQAHGNSHGKKWTREELHRG
jgi:uncharacterized protein (DUF111 family)